MNIGGFLPFSMNDYPGHMASVVFTQGCNFRCPYCHNQDLLAPRAGTYSCDEIFKRLAHKSKLMDAVVVSGGEATIQPDLPGFCRQLRTIRKFVKLDTNGSRPEMLAELLSQSLVDYVAMDIKAPWEKYSSLSGAEVNCEAIARSAALIAESGVEHHFRTTFDTTLLDGSDLESIRAALPPKSCHIVQACRYRHIIQNNNTQDITSKELKCL